MERKVRLMILLLLVACTASAHPLHLSFTNLEFRAGDSRWKITIKVFSDDFANSLNVATGFEGQFSKKSKSLEYKDIFKKWLTPLLTVSFDQKEIPVSDWTFEGLKIQEDATWLSFSFQAPVPVDEVRVKNTIHFDIFADQKNLFIFTMGRFQSAFQFRHKEAETVIRLNQ